MKTTCPDCDGEGKRLREKEKCKKCKGKKVLKEKKRIEFMIEPGTEDGERIALRGEGDEAVSQLLDRNRFNFTSSDADSFSLSSPISQLAMLSSSFDISHTHHSDIILDLQAPSRS